MTPYDLDDALYAALHRTRWRLTRPWRIHRHAIHLTAPTVQIRDAHGVIRSWSADTRDEHGYAFTRRQARQIRRALADVIRAEAEALRRKVEAQVLAIAEDEPPQ